MKMRYGGLSVEQRVLWNTMGFIVLRKVLPPELISEVVSSVSNVWQHKSGGQRLLDVLTGPRAGSVLRMRDADFSIEQEVYKLNSLYLDCHCIRKCSYLVAGALADIMHAEPLLCASINFGRGSQQPYHIDSWFFPSPSEKSLIGANFLLENVDQDNGPLTYYPASHLIPPFRFSDGGIRITSPDATDCCNYVEAKVRERALVPECFTGDAGDVILWHAQLYHGGMPIRDFNRTRRSLVMHFWRKGDVEEEAVLDCVSGAYLKTDLRGPPG